MQDTFVLTDRNSSNGTLVNGVAVRSHELADGDLIQLGHTLLLFVDAEQESLSHTAAERVHLLQRHDPADRSSIVSQIDRQVLSPTIPTIPTGEDNSPSNLTVLYRIAEEVVRPSVSMDQSLQRILDLTIEAVGADRGCVLLTDPQSGEIHPRVASQRGAAEPGSRMPVSRDRKSVV